MRIGLMLGSNEGDRGALEGLIAEAQQAEADGFDHLWMANIFGLDAISSLGMAGLSTSKIRLGTAVTPTYPRHPTAIAQQALTSGAAAGGRFTLGIGLSHKVVIEDMLGMSYAAPAKHMREYLSILAPLLRGETVNFQGEQYTANNVALDIPGRQPVKLLVAALGPVMLKIAGELADGTITWMTGPKTLSEYIMPGINSAANAAGRGDAEVAAGFPVALTHNVDETREYIGKTLQIYGMLPSYRAMLDKEGVAGPAELALVGDENALRSDITRLRDMGVTDFCGAVVAPDTEAAARTREFLLSLR